MAQQLKYVPIQETPEATYFIQNSRPYIPVATVSLNGTIASPVSMVDYSKEPGQKALTAYALLDCAHNFERSFFLPANSAVLLDSNTDGNKFMLVLEYVDSI